MSTTLTDELIRIAKEAGEAAEKSRQQMLAASDRRAEAVYALWAEGKSVRQMAELLGVSPSVSQRLLEKARDARPHFSRREERVSYELHRAVAEKVAEDPQVVLSKARTNLQKLAARVRDTYAQGWVAEWEKLITLGDVQQIRDVMLSSDERGIDLRQMTPFAGVLSQEERLVAIHKASRAA
jgi:transposase